MKIERHINKKSIFSILVIFVILIMVIAFSIIYHHNTYFTVDKWNAYSWNDRQLLIKSFLKQNNLNQMTKGEIIELLGFDTAYDQNSFIPFKTDDNLVYDFGLQKNATASNITLIISFDENNHVSSYELKSYSQ